jgi:predicted phosphate transport protein (TIGR00153 family)
MGNYVSKIFGESPVTPIQQHIEICHKAACELVPLFQAAMKGEWDAVDAVREQIVAMEHDADDLKNRVRSHLPKSLFMPVPREDLLNLLLVQDKIANKARDISGLVVGRRMVIPPQMHDSFIAYVRSAVAASRKARKSVGELDELYETGFRGAEAKLVESLVADLDLAENESDALEAAVRGELFTIEKELPPVDVMFLYRVIELIGDVADMAQRVGRRLELILSH